MRVGIVACLIFGLLSLCLGDTMIAKAKIAEVTERGFILTVGTEAVPVQDESATHFWKDRKPAARGSFAVGDAVTVRLKTDSAPVVVREMADSGTYDWLDKLRKDIVSGTVAKIDPRFLVLRLDSGGEFAFRYSDKTKLEVQGAKSVTDLKEGQKLYVKGRLLPTLDTWVVTLSDQKLESATKTKGSTAGKDKAPKPLHIGASGVLKGIVDLHRPVYLMVDIMVDGRLVHVMYTAKTTFKMDGNKADTSDIERGLRIEATYRRDQFGRLICSKIELFHGG